MAFQLKRRLYKSLPMSVKRTVCLVPFGWIAGRAYRETMARNGLFERASREEILAYQEKKLGEMLRFVTDQIPAYHNLRSAVERFSPFDALKEFPILDKDTLQKNRQNYLPRDFERIPHYEISTGGTSGNQLTFFVDDVSQSVEMAFMHRQWRRVDYTPQCRKATFRGVSFSNLKPDVYWQNNPIYNELQFSPFHMTEKTLGAYVEKLVEFKPSHLHGYPSAIDVLAEYVLRNGLRGHMPRIRAALLGSEDCTQAQRERIEEALQTRAFSWYGLSERVVLAGECEMNETYHHFPDYGILEIIADDGTPCQQEGQRGEIVGTGLLNRSLPLIRYRTSDYAVRCEPHCECGRRWDRFTSVQGRWKQEMVVGKDNARMSIAALNMHGVIFKNIIRYQYFQEKAGACELRVMVSPNFSETDRLRIQQAYMDKVGGQLVFTVRVVEDIPLTPRGKLKLLHSTLNHPDEVGCDSSSNS